MQPATLNVASRLAMLAERMTKMHAQIGRDILVVRSKRSLAEASAEFERGLKEASTAASSIEARDGYRLLRALWDEFRPAVAHAPSPEGGRKLAERTEELAWVAAKGVRQLHDQRRSRAGELVISSGNARAAAQRLGKLHLLRGWALSQSAGARDVKLAEGEILLAVTQLKSAPESGEDAVAALAMAESQLALLREAAERLDRGKDQALQLDHIAKGADVITEAMDRAAKDYAAVPR